MAISPVKDVDPLAPVLLKASKPPVESEVEEEEIVSATDVVRESEVKVISLFVESQPKPDVSEAIVEEVSKKAICPAVPEPVIPVEEAMQSAQAEPS